MLSCDTVCEGGTEREQWCLLHSPPDFSHSLCYPLSNWARLVLVPKWVGLCTLQAPVGLSNNLSCDAGSFSCSCPTPTGVFTERFEALFPGAGALGCVVCHLVHQLLPRCESSLPSCPSLPLLLVWMNVYFLSPWCWTSLLFDFLSVLVV